MSAALASRADDDDTIDLAVLAGLDDKKALHGYKVVHFEPFDPATPAGITVREAIRDLLTR